MVATTTEKRRPISVESAGRVVGVIAVTGVTPCESRWRRQLANTARRLVQVGKDDSWIASEVRDMLGQVRRTKRPGPAAVEVVELPRPRPKEAGGGELASVHAIAEERRPKTKTKTENKAEEAEAEHATHRQEEESRWVADAKAASAVQGQVSKLARIVKGLQRQRVSTDREIKQQRAWVKAAVKERAMAAQVQQVEGIRSELAAMKEQVSRVEQEVGVIICMMCGDMASRGQQVEGSIPGLAAVREQVSRLETLEVGLRAEVGEPGQAAQLMVARVRRGEERVGTLEDMTGRSFIESPRAVAKPNEDIARLYEKTFGALVEERLTPDGEGWYTEQIDFVLMTARHGASVADRKGGGHSDERAA